jgi:hypothetical protein
LPDHGVTADQTAGDIGEPDGSASDLSADRSHAPDAAGPALCPGGKPLFGGAVSGVFKGTAKVTAGSFNKGGTHPATLALAAICGSVRGLLIVEQSSSATSGVVSYKLKGTIGTGAVTKLSLIASDRYCAGIDCMPHLTANAGMEIFDVDLQPSGASLSSTKIDKRAGVSYPNLELPFSSLTVTRDFPPAKQAHDPGAAAVDGAWEARLLTSTEVFAVPPVSGDNTLTLAGKVKSWKLSFSQNALADKQMFPTALLDALHRRVSIAQNTLGGTFDYSAVLDGNWLIGVARAGTATGSGSPDVPTDFSPDDALHGIWIGYRKGD